MIVIDGSEGEGGGQILRTSLSLAAITGHELAISQIRAKRSRPGLLRQHLTAVRAMAEVCGARLRGAELGSTELRFAPGKVRHGSYHFAVGTAGSATLVLQTLLPALLLTDGESELILEGGTHNTGAPPYPFVDRTFLPILRSLGADVVVELERPGFYPAGGGRLRVQLRGGAPLGALSLQERDAIEAIEFCAIVSGLPRHVAKRELETLAAQFGDYPTTVRLEEVTSVGPGNVLIASVRTKSITETFSAFGERGVKAETIAHNLARTVRTYLASGSPVGEHLADQLLLPLALSAGGEFRTSKPSQHTLTNRDIIERFLGKCIVIDMGVEASAQVKISGQKAV